MSTPIQDQRLARRVEELTANDPQFAAAKPDPAVAEALETARTAPSADRPDRARGLRRPAGARPARRRVRHRPDDRPHLTPSCSPASTPSPTVSCGDRVGALARALTPTRCSAGDRVAMLGFTSVDYTTIDMALAHVGAVSVPLQTSAPLTQLQPIVAETEPVVIASSVDHLADAVELILTGHRPGRLVVFDYHPEVDDQREAFEAAAHAAGRHRVVVETLAEVLERGNALPDAAGPRGRRRRPAGPADLHLRQHRHAQGRDVPAEQCRQMWRRGQHATGSGRRRCRRSRSTSCR